MTRPVGRATRLPGVLRAVAVAAAVLAAAATEARGADLVSAEGTVRIDGRDVRVEPRRPVPLPKDARLDVVSGSATVRSRAGDEVRLSAGAALRSDGDVKGVEYLFLVSGSADAQVTPATSVGTQAGWTAAPEGTTVRLRIDVVPGARHGDTTVRTSGGGAWVRYFAVDVWLPAGGAVTLRPAAVGPGTLGFDVPADAAAAAELVRGRTGEARTAAVAAPGTSGSLSDAPARGASPGGASPGGAAWTCDRAPRGGLLRIELRTAGGTRPAAAIGAGVTCVVDARGGVGVQVKGVPEARLRRVLALDREFATVSE